MRGSALAAIALLGLLSWPAGAGADDRPAARASWSETAPIIDGLMDDPAWARSRAYSGFVERSPSLRSVPPVRTSFRVLYGPNALYIGIVCEEPNRDDVRAATRTRDDAAMFSDDAISIKLDPALDRRNTLGFVVNPAGARLDYRGIDESDFRIEFDTNWRAAAAYTPDGWSVEMSIPYRSLGIDATDPPARIGLNLSRDHGRRSATYDWALLPPPYSPIAASRYGSLLGLDELPAKLAEAGIDPANVDSSTRSFVLKPYALGGFRREEGERASLDNEALINGGVDAIAHLGRFRGELTLNTDFAQVDLDNQVVNLTRFGLFLPEKRDFFLSDVELLSFGRRGDGQMLYSRRIGLDEDDGEVPIVGGLKVVGSAGDNVRVGALEVVTRPSGDTPWESNTVARGQVELGGGSNVGLMAVHRQALEVSRDRNTMFGVDGAWRGDEVPLILRTFVLASVTGSEAREPESATGGDGRGENADHLFPGVGVAASLRNEMVRPALSYAYYHPELRGDLGFFRRVGVHDVDGGLTVEKRIDASGLEKMRGGPFAGIVTEADEQRMLDWGAGGFAELFWQRGFYAGADAAREVETVLEPFTVGRDTAIAAGEYRGARARVYGSTPGSYFVSLFSSFGGRDYYTGRRLDWNTSLTLKASELLRLGVATNYNRAEFEHLPDFDSVVVNGRVGLGFTNELGLSLFSGYNLLNDVLQVQSRLRWIYRPGSDLYIVCQADLDDDTWNTTFYSFIAKTQFVWEP